MSLLGDSCDPYSGGSEVDTYLSGIRRKIVSGVRMEKIEFPASPACVPGSSWQMNVPLGLMFTEQSVF